MKKFLMAAAAAAAMACAAPAANATTFTQLNQTDLDTLGSSIFGATIDSSGVFNHSFDFTTSDPKDASGSIITITLGGAWDVDFTSVTLDGNPFQPVTTDATSNPPGTESWALGSTTIDAGSHTINVIGTVNSNSQSNAGSYSGTLNIANVPEPGTWALMITGFGAAGAMLRRKRALSLA